MKTSISRRKTATILTLLIISLISNTCKKEEAISIPELATLEISEITYNAAKSGGSISNDGGNRISSRGVVWSLSNNPTLENSIGYTKQGRGVGLFTSHLNGLDENTDYYVRAYAVNDRGISYGESKIFTTKVQLKTPLVITESVNDIERNSVIVNYVITDDGGVNVTQRGICWSSVENPTIKDNFTEDGDGTGSFTSEISELFPGSTYYVRGYATNNIGTSYGEQLSFSTLPDIPEVITTGISGVRAYSAVVSGKVIHNGGAEIYEQGICWATNENPTIGDLFTGESGHMDEYEHLLNNLDVHQTYYARAYSSNSQGTSYGEQLIFTTTPVIGDFYQGGIVFFLDNKGGGLACAPSDQSADAMWGCYGQFIGLTSTAFGMGNYNTSAIINNCAEEDTAAKLCNELILDQYDDWYLPSKNELNTVFEILKKNGLGNFANAVYWSSSELSANRSWAVGFGNGVSVEANKAAGYRVRAIRTF